MKHVRDSHKGIPPPLPRLLAWLLMLLMASNLHYGRTIPTITSISSTIMPSLPTVHAFSYSTTIIGNAPRRRRAAKGHSSSTINAAHSSSGSSFLRPLHDSNHQQQDSHNNDNENLLQGPISHTACTTFELIKTVPQPKRRRRRFFRRRKEARQINETFHYDYNMMQVDASHEDMTNATIGVLLIHPIGVGISKWYYDRLFEAFTTSTPNKKNLLLISPDLLGSGSALWQEPAGDANHQHKRNNKRPALLNISDWTGQMTHLMMELEQNNNNNIDQWCIVANGGCSPIALQIAARAVSGTAPFQRPVTNVVLSAVPRLPFFLDAAAPGKVAQSYRTLAGPAGNLFWWYACRNEGAFIQTFSEKNLVADAANLGPNWRPNCFATATQNGGASRYSTFSFLAGTLQDGCVDSLNALMEKEISIDFIKGRDVRQNRAKSWFWQRRNNERGRRQSKQEERQEPVTEPTTDSYVEEETTRRRMTLLEYLNENNVGGGREVLVGGRISLAHEDANGYRDAILSFLQQD